ncbi:MAG: hypothetical protein AAF962_02660 [Actinomycetota bacterium]
MELHGHILRHAATEVVHTTRGPCSIGYVLAELERRGFAVEEPERKRVSDALRSSVGNGRVIRHARGRYVAGRISHGTRRRWQRRLRGLDAYGRRHPEASLGEGIAWARGHRYWH